MELAALSSIPRPPSAAALTMNRVRIARIP
jgi:hypothetical protein